jgi:hypothetical protein
MLRLSDQIGAHDQPREASQRFQHAADHIRKPGGHSHQLRASAQESSGPMCIERFHMDRSIPSNVHDLRQALGIVLIGFIEPHL